MIQLKARFRSNDGPWARFDLNIFIYEQSAVLFIEHRDAPNGLTQTHCLPPSFLLSISNL